MYGSFIPLQKTDVLKHLRRKFNTDFSNRFVGDGMGWEGGYWRSIYFKLYFISPNCSKNVIFPEVDKYRTAIVQKSVPSFQVVYRKHTLTLDDLCTLADQNWLNDQVGAQFPSMPERV